jgi:hypothetical protein
MGTTAMAALASPAAEAGCYSHPACVHRCACRVSCPVAGILSSALEDDIYAGMPYLPADASAVQTG